MTATAHIITKDPLPFFCCMATVVMLAEFSAIAALSLPHGLIMAVIEHLMIIWLLSVWVYYSYGSRDSRLMLLLLVMTAATGPFGAGICLLVAMLYTLARNDSGAVPCQWIDDFFSYEEARESDMLHERIDLGLDNASGKHIEPFQDILSGGTVLQKQMVISKITQHFHPRFAPQLLQALQDTNAAVRVQAATSLARIEHDFMEEYLRNERPPESGSHQDEVRLHTAALCDDYAHAGITDREGCHDYRNQAIEIYEEYLTRANNPESRQYLARLYLRQKQPEKTCLLLSGAIESGDTTASAVLWYMEALFCLKEMGKLRQVAKNYAHLLGNFDGYKSPGEARDVLAAWGVKHAA